MLARIALGVTVFASIAIGAAPAAAQSRPDVARLLVTVVDQSGAVIPNAKVTVTGQEPATSKAEIAPAPTSLAGVATIDGLPAGRYTIQAEFRGFETVTVRDVRVRAGDNASLDHAADQEDRRGRDRRAATSRAPRSIRAAMAFSTVLTREQIAALPDDPDEMAAVLQAMAPPGVDDPRGRVHGRPAAAEVADPIDPAAAHGHDGRAEPRRPEGRDLHRHHDAARQRAASAASTDFTLRDDALNARNPFTPVKGDERLKRVGVSMSGHDPAEHVRRISFDRAEARQYDTATCSSRPSRGSMRAEPCGSRSRRSNINGRIRSRGEPEITCCALALQRVGVRALGTWASAASISPSARTRRDIADNIVRDSPRTVRSAGGSSASRGCRCAGRIEPGRVDARGADDPRARRVHQRRRAAVGVDVTRSSSRPRPISTTSAARTRCAPASSLEGGRYRSDDMSNYLGTYHVREPRRLRGRPAVHLHAADRRSDRRLHNLQVGLYVQDDYRMSRRACC